MGKLLVLIIIGLACSLLISYILSATNVLNPQLFIALLLLGVVIPLVVWDHFRGHRGFLKRKGDKTVSIYPVFYGYPAFGITPLIIIILIVSVQIFPLAFAIIFVSIVFLSLVLASKFIFIQSTPKITVQGKVFPLWFMYDDWQSLAEIHVSDTDITEVKDNIFRLQINYYPLSKIHDFRLETADNESKVMDKSTGDKSAYSLLAILFGTVLIKWWFTKQRTLHLIGTNGETVGSINLHGYDDQAVERLVSTLSRKAA